jgi:hypothetical protein
MIRKRMEDEKPERASSGMVFGNPDPTHPK